MSNPNNALGTNAAFGGRTSVNAFNDVMSAFSGRGIISGWGCAPSSGLTVTIGGNGTDRDVAIAEDSGGNKTSINNISQAPISVTISAAPASNSRIDAIVAYIESSPSSNAITDNYDVVNLLTVTGTAASTPSAPDDNAIRTAITADGASGSTAYYVVLAYITISSGTTDIDAGMIASGGSATLITGNVPPITSSMVDFTSFNFGNYSLTEQDTGFTWVDGKHIYKKTVNFGSCPNKTSKTVSSGITNMDKMIKLEGIAYSSSAVFYMGPSLLTFYSNTMLLGEGSWSLTYNKSENKINMTTGANRSDCTAYITVYYTKTS